MDLKAITCKDWVMHAATHAIMQTKKGHHNPINWDLF
jgi:hypothetical protein